MDHRQLDLEQLREMTAGHTDGGFTLAEILAEFGAGTAGVSAPESKQEIRTEQVKHIEKAESARPPEPPRHNSTEAPAPGGTWLFEPQAVQPPEPQAVQPPEPQAVQPPEPQAAQPPEPDVTLPFDAPQAAQPSAAPDEGWHFARRAALPSEAEIRAFVAEYKATDGAAQRPDEPEIDPRFRLGAQRQERELRYDGKAVDLGVAEGYVPHAAPEYISSYAPDAPVEEEEEPDAAPRLPFMDRLRKRLEHERGAYLEKEQARREAAEKRPDLRGAKEFALPEEQAAEAQEAVSDETQRIPSPPRHVSYEPQEAVPEATRRLDADTLRQEMHAAAPKSEFSPAWTRGMAQQRAYASVFPDTSARPAVYAAQSDYEYEEPEEDERENEGASLLGEDFFPPTFKEYIFSRLTIFLYRLRGGMTGALTAEEDDEDLGPEVPVARASKYYGSFLRSQRLRLLVSGVLLLVMAWISLGMPVTGRFNDTAVAALFCLAIQLTVMLLCLDVVVKAFSNALRGRFGADFLALLACVVTSLDALLSSLSGFGTAHLPLCLLSSLSLAGVLLSSHLSCQGLRKSLRVPAIAKRSYAVTGETNTHNGEVTLLKSVRPLKGFVRRAEEAPPDETLFQKLGLPMLALVLLLTLVAAAVKRNLRDIFYILSVLLCPAVPFTALLAFAVPFAQGSRRLFPSGAAVAGWSGVCDIGQSRSLIVTDRDLFPEGTVELDTVRIFADVQPERIISYAGSLLCASGSGLSGCFADLMQRKNCPMRQIENFETLPGGGFRGIIDSSVILCGSTDLMQLMNVRIPYRLVGRRSVLLAVDGVLYGIFNIKYTPDAKVRSALLHLVRAGRHPVFAIRDFNVTPSMLHETFEVATDGYDFPPYVERFPLSQAEPGPDSKIAAIVGREGLGPLSDTADFGRTMYVYTRVNLYAAALSAVLGVLVSFVRLLATGGVGVGFLLVFMLLWSLPTLLTGIALRVN